jgi:hypothetical protein
VELSISKVLDIPESGARCQRHNQQIPSGSIEDLNEFAAISTPLMRQRNPAFE